MKPIAQTNLQLYNQLRDQGYSYADQLTVHRAYEFLTTIYPGYYQADGKPFVAHTVGVASILAHLQLPIEFVVTGLLHNIYGNGDFGDGRRDVTTSRRRRIVKKAVGNHIEILIARFPKCRIRSRNIQEILSGLEGLDETHKKLIVIELADYLEKYFDLGVCYWGNSRSLANTVAKNGEKLKAIALRLGYPVLAGMLNETFISASVADIPDGLRTSKGWKELQLVVPRSCRQRIQVLIRKRWTHFQQRHLFRRLFNRLPWAVGQR